MDRSSRRNEKFRDASYGHRQQIVKSKEICEKESAGTIFEAINFTLLWEHLQALYNEQ